MFETGVTLYPTCRGPDCIFVPSADLIDACVASSTIPGLTGALLGGHATFRGKTVLDGGILVRSLLRGYLLS